jgi:prepilin-type N-terminal cleavage/methylation domain-containing protein
MNRMSADTRRVQSLTVLIAGDAEQDWQRNRRFGGDAASDGVAVSQLPIRIRRSTFNSGFTLIELLVAAGITAMLAGFIAVIVSNVSGVWARSGNRLGTDAQARIVLDQLQLDLQGALFRDDGNVWFAVDVLNNTGNSGLWQPAGRNGKPTTNLSLQMTQPNLANTRYGVAGVWLRFFTTSRGANSATSPASISAPVAVGYQIIRRFTATNPANMDTAYLLHRAEARPGATGTGANLRPGVLESGYDIAGAAYSGTNSITNNNGSNPGDPRAVRVPGSARILDAVIADNVIDFGVRCYVRDSSVPGGLRLIFPANANGNLSNATNTPLRGKMPSNTPSTVEDFSHLSLFPDVVDVMVRILTDQGASLLTNIEKVQTPALPVPPKYNNNVLEWWWGVAQENSRVYTRRIVVNAKSS